MPSILPEGEELRRAIRWISLHLREGAGDDPTLLRKLVDEAALRFDLSPRESEFLWEFYRKKSSVQDGKGEKGTSS